MKFTATLARRIGLRLIAISDGMDGSTTNVVRNATIRGGITLPRGDAIVTGCTFG